MRHDLTFDQQVPGIAVSNWLVNKNLLPGMPFVHLDCCSDFSLGESVLSIKQLVEHAANQPFPAIGLADIHGMFGVVQLYTQAHKAGVKPLVGLSTQLAWDQQKSQRLLLYAMNTQGYTNLKKMATLINLEPASGYAKPTLTQPVLEAHQDGLLVICDGLGGVLAELLTSGRLQDANALIDYLSGLFSQRLYFALQRIGHPGENSFNSSLLELARLRQLPLIATNPARFTCKEDLELAEIRYAIEHAQTYEKVHREQVFYPGQYLRNNQEMSQLFADMPQLLQNSVEFAKRCNLELATGAPLLPDFGGDNAPQQLRGLATEGLQQRLEARSEVPPQEQQEAYYQRLNMELQTIRDMQFSSYFLIVHEFIHWAKENNVTVGPGRGSVAGSLVAWCLGITEIDPIPFDLVFERFLNPARKSMPDIDIDFCIRDRDKVYQHVVDRYGKDAVAQIITFGKLRPKAAIRDVTRVLGYSYGLGDRVARHVPEKPDMTFALAFEESQELQEVYTSDDEARQVIDLAQRLEGVVRNLGKHAAGVVIAPGEITDYAPLYRDKSRALITQYYKDDLDVIGLVKFDFLGLDTLTTLDQATAMIERLYNLPVDLNQLPFDDPKTYQLLQEGDTIGVFQLESGGMRKHLRNLEPSSFDDITAMLALYRPGPMDFIADFIDRKHGRVEIAYPHPLLESILSTTYGVAVYQEQVMRIAQQLSGYSLAEADNLRRAMGKKKPEIMEEQRQIFIQRAVDNGVAQFDAQKVFEYIAPFAGYGFNKSHSAAYAVLTYRTCWVKAHYPLAFYASMISSPAAGSARINILYKDCRKRGITLLPPHVNHSRPEFDVNAKDQLVFGFLGIKGVGEHLALGIVEERKIAPYAGLFDFVQRLERNLITKTSLEALVCAGAFDGLDMTRAELFGNIEQALRLADQLRTNHHHGIGDLFGGVNNKQMLELSRAHASVWSVAEMLERERKVIGFYLTAHPYDSQREDFAPLISHSLQQASGLALGRNNRDGVPAQLAGAVIDLRERFARRGKEKKPLREKLFSIEDGLHLIEARATELCPAYKHILEGQVLLFCGQIKHDAFVDEAYLEIENCYTATSARCHFATGIRIRFARGATRDNTIAALRDFLAQHLSPQGIKVCVELYKEGVITEVALGEHWRLTPAPELLEKFTECCSFATLALEFRAT